MNAVGNLCEEDMVNKYDWENAGVTREHNYSEIKWKNTMFLQPMKIVNMQNSCLKVYLQKSTLRYSHTARQRQW